MDNELTIGKRINFSKGIAQGKRCDINIEPYKK
jgi:hypothetical protein